MNNFPSRNTQSYYMEQILQIICEKFITKSGKIDREVFRRYKYIFQHFVTDTQQLKIINSVFHIAAEIDLKMLEDVFQLLLKKGCIGRRVLLHWKNIDMALPSAKSKIEALESLQTFYSSLCQVKCSCKFFLRI